VTTQDKRSGDDDFILRRGYEGIGKEAKTVHSGKELSSVIAG
jgi:hypothetical protein